MTPRALNKSLSILASAWIILALAKSPAAAQQIVWGSPVGLDSYTSGGAAQLVDGSFTFQLGTFLEAGSPGWTPTPENVAEWSDHWVAVDSAAYNETLKAFTGSGMAPPELVGLQGYIWGFNTKESGGEWVLITNASWVFPSDSGGDFSFPETWQSSGANTAVLGTLGPSPESPPHLQTVAVQITPSSLIPAMNWLETYFTEAQQNDPLVGAWAADPDRDGLSNLLELATAGHPWESSCDCLPTLLLTEVSGQFYLSIRATKAPGTNLVINAEVSSDLSNWNRGSPHVTVVQNTDTEIVLRDNTPFQPNQNRFIRLVVTLPGGL